MNSMTKQRREGEADGSRGQRRRTGPSWTESVRLAHQAVVAIAGTDMINHAGPRACGCNRGSRRLDTKWPETDEPQVLRQTKPRLASSRTGENPPYGMNGGGGGNIGMTRGLFATMLERADPQEAIGLNSDAPQLHSTSFLSVTAGRAKSEFLSVMYALMKTTWAILLGLLLLAAPATVQSQVIYDYTNSYGLWNYFINNGGRIPTPIRRV